MTGCGDRPGAPRTIARSLPPEPGYVQPVALPNTSGQVCTVAKLEYEYAINDANGIIVSFRDWYRGVRSDYARDR